MMSISRIRYSLPTILRQSIFTSIERVPPVVVSSNWSLFSQRSASFIPTIMSRDRGELYNSPANNFSHQSNIILSARQFSSRQHLDNLNNPESYTETAFACITKLPNYAVTYKTQYIEVPHMLKSLYDDGPDSLTHSILAKAGISVDDFNK